MAIFNRQNKPSNEEVKREQSPYSKFMHMEVEKLKEEFPNLKHTELFKLAANNWKEYYKMKKYL